MPYVAQVEENTILSMPAACAARSEHFIESAAIPDVAYLKWTPFHEFSMAIREIVIHDWREALVE